MHLYVYYLLTFTLGVAGDAVFIISLCASVRASVCVVVFTASCLMDDGKGIWPVKVLRFRQSCRSRELESCDSCIIVRASMSVFT